MSKFPLSVKNYPQWNCLLLYDNFCMEDNTEFSSQTLLLWLCWPTPSQLLVNSTGQLRLTRVSHWTSNKGDHTTSPQSTKSILPLYKVFAKKYPQRTM